MSRAILEKLDQALQKIDRPGSFCAGGDAPAIFPGLKTNALGPIGLPLTAKQAKELKKHCEQAPYGKGEETLVDTSVRRVWRMKPEQFTLTNPDWKEVLQDIVDRVQQQLGLEKQKLGSHLYELLLYEPGSFFLPHRDGEKLDRMVATLGVVMPSAFEGGELVVRHEGQEQVFDFGSGQDNQFRIHWAAFYADCEHEIRPLRKGYRLCLVYNLVLKKGTKGLRAPRSAEHIEPIRQFLDGLAQQDTPQKVAVTLAHQYTQEGLAWDALKGVDRARADVLLEAARQADWQAYLSLLTFHQAGSAEGAYDYDYYGRGYGRRRGWSDNSDDPGDYEMGEVYDSSLTAEHWTDAQGKRLPFGTIGVDEEELLDPEALTSVDPEEEFEGYTGNAGMTLDRWYRHGAIILWPRNRHFEILCGAGTNAAIESLTVLVKKWQKASKKNAAALRAECLEFASAIIATWRENPYGAYHVKEEPDAFFPLLEALGEPELIKGYLSQVLIKDAGADPGKLLVNVCEQHGWGTFQPELEIVFKNTTAATLQRNVRLLEQICLAKPKKKAEWITLCETLAQTMLQALEEVDQEKTDSYDYRFRNADRGKVLAGLARALLAAEQAELLARLVAHTLAQPKMYPLTTAHMAALTTLQPWLKKNVKTPSPALSHWLAACAEQLEALTAEKPQPPPDFRRDADISCNCQDCSELKQFLKDRQEQVHRFRVREDRRAHLQHMIQRHHCDLDLKEERQGTPYSLICTKNTASYQARLKKYHEDLEHLTVVRSIQGNLPK